MAMTTMGVAVTMTMGVANCGVRSCSILLKIPSVTEQQDDGLDDGCVLAIGPELWESRPEAIRWIRRSPSGPILPSAGDIADEDLELGDERSRGELRGEHLPSWPQEGILLPPPLLSLLLLPLELMLRKRLEFPSSLGEELVIEDLRREGSLEWFQISSREQELEHLCDIVGMSEVDLLVASHEVGVEGRRRGGGRGRVVRRGEEKVIERGAEEKGTLSFDVEEGEQQLQRSERRALRAVVTEMTKELWAESMEETSERRDRSWEESGAKRIHSNEERGESGERILGERTVVRWGFVRSEDAALEKKLEEISVAHEGGCGERRERMASEMRQRRERSGGVWLLTPSEKGQKGGRRRKRGKGCWREGGNAEGRQRGEWCAAGRGHPSSQEAAEEMGFVGPDLRKILCLRLLALLRKISAEGEVQEIDQHRAVGMEDWDQEERFCESQVAENLAILRELSWGEKSWGKEGGV
jgi:hypothetical protein